jgi:hypothetical protein
MFHSFADSRPLLGSPSLLPFGYRGALSPGVKGPEHEIVHSLPSSTKIKNDGAVL